MRDQIRVGKLAMLHPLFKTKLFTAVVTKKHPRTGRFLLECTFAGPSCGNLWVCSVLGFELGNCKCNLGFQEQQCAEGASATDHLISKTPTAIQFISAPRDPSLAWVQTHEHLSHYPHGAFLHLLQLWIVVYQHMIVDTTSAFFPSQHPHSFFFGVRKCQPLRVSHRKWMGNLQIPVNTHKLSHDLLSLFNGWCFATPRSLGFWIQQSYCASLWNVRLFHKAKAHTTWSWASTQSL